MGLFLKDKAPTDELFNNAIPTEKQSYDTDLRLFDHIFLYGTAVIKIHVYEDKTLIIIGDMYISVLYE